MMSKTISKTKYALRYTTGFKKDLKRIKKQGKDLDKIKYVINKLANGEDLDEKYRNHILTDSKHYKNCGECHITPDWLLVYKIYDNELVLLLFATGSHSELFSK